jgi:hypothetical protein
MEATNESFLYRHRLGISITLVLLVSGFIALTSAVRSMKAGSVNSVAQTGEQSLCQPSTLPYAQLQEDWRAYEGRQHLNGLSLPDLGFQKIDEYIAQQCITAKSIVQSAKTAQTDKEKAALYDQAIKLSQESDTASLEVAQIIYGQATACVDALGKAVEADTDGTNALTAKAKTYASSGNWGYCSYFSAEAVIDLTAQNKCDNTFARATKLADPQNSFLIAATTYRQQSDWESCAYFSDRAIEDTNAMLSCQESYAQAQAMSLQLNMPQQNIADATVSMEASDWSSCSFYSEQAIAVLAPYMPTATPSP